MWIRIELPDILGRFGICQTKLMEHSGVGQRCGRKGHCVVSQRATLMGEFVGRYTTYFFWRSWKSIGTLTNWYDYNNPYFSRDITKKTRVSWDRIGVSWRDYLMKWRSMSAEGSAPVRSLQWRYVEPQLSTAGRWEMIVPLIHRSIFMLVIFFHSFSVDLTQLQNFSASASALQNMLRWPTKRWEGLSC